MIEKLKNPQGYRELESKRTFMYDCVLVPCVLAKLSAHQGFSKIWNKTSERYKEYCLLSSLEHVNLKNK